MLNGVGAGLARCLELESVAALCVAVWGYPQFAAGDQVTIDTNNVTIATNTVTNVVTNAVTVGAGDPVLLPGSPGGYHPPPPARRQAALRGGARQVNTISTLQTSIMVFYMQITIKSFLSIFAVFGLNSLKCPADPIIQDMLLNINNKKI